MIFVYINIKINVRKIEIIIIIRGLWGGCPAGTLCGLPPRVNFSSDSEFCLSTHREGARPAVTGGKEAPR